MVREQSSEYGEALSRQGALIFGTDTPFAFGNFFHSVMNEVRALKLAGLPNEAILGMATSDAANAPGISDRVGTIEPGRLADLSSSMAIPSLTSRRWGTLRWS